MIERSNPDVGYIAPDAFGALGFTQVIRAGDTLYVSGTTPLTGDLHEVKLVGEDDLRAQVVQTLDVLERCLAAHGASFEHWVAQTVYTTDMDALIGCAEIFRERFGPHPPTSTWVEVTRLFHPKQQIEISGIAIRPPAGR